MKTNACHWRRAVLYSAMAAMFTPFAAVGQSATDAANALPITFTWTTVANSAEVIPGGDGVTTFNSFNQPSVNGNGLVVLRARSKGGDAASGGDSGKPFRGIYSRQMGRKVGPLTVVFDTRTVVPGPNNVMYLGQLGTLTEFPAFPRIGIDSNTTVTRGQSKPVYEYQVGTDPVTGQPITTRTGTSGVYAMRQGERVAAMTQLGAVPGFDYYSVPGATPGVKFDQFPGSPAVASTNAAVFKGNYTDGVSKTGIFFRTFEASGAPAKTQVIASSDTLIPGQPVGGTTFGSTAPPSAVGSDAVFLGLDNEAAPTLGGIYRAPLATKPALQTLVSIGGQVPGEDYGVTFNRLGEGLSFDGRFVAFWGTWGSKTDVRDVTLRCPTDGQAAVIDYCNKTYPNGFVVQVPTKQGIFVHDSKAGKGDTFAVVKTGGEYYDFIYWTFSGRPPGVGESEAEDFEAPRWRSSAFAATHTQSGKAQVAFKGRKTSLVDGIYLSVAPASPAIYRTVIETGMDGGMIDLQAAGIPVISVGLERDGLRNGWLAIAASMANSETGWAGVYVTRTDKQK